VRFAVLGHNRVLQAIDMPACCSLAWRLLQHGKMQHATYAESLGWLQEDTQSGEKMGGVAAHLLPVFSPAARRGRIRSLPPAPPGGVAGQGGYAPSINMTPDRAAARLFSFTRVESG